MLLLNCCFMANPLLQYPSGAFTPYGDELLPVLAWLSSHSGVVGQAQAWTEASVHGGGMWHNPGRCHMLHADTNAGSCLLLMHALCVCSSLGRNFRITLP